MQDLCQVLTHADSITQAFERAFGGHWLPQELQARRENLRRGRDSLQRQLEGLTEAYLAEAICRLESDPPETGRQLFFEGKDERIECTKIMVWFLLGLPVAMLLAGTLWWIARFLGFFGPR